MSLIDRPAGPFAKSRLSFWFDLGSAAVRFPAGQRLGISAWTRRETMTAVLCLAGFALLAQAFWWFSGYVVPWDSKNHFYPMFRFLADSLQRGEVPLWNPYHFGGHPSAADPQSLLLTPSLFLFALIAPHASMAAFDAWIMLHLFAGGLGMMALG